MSIEQNILNEIEYQEARSLKEIEEELNNKKHKDIFYDEMMCQTKEIMDNDGITEEDFFNMLKQKDERIFGIAEKIANIISKSINDKYIAKQKEQSSYEKTKISQFECEAYIPLNSFLEKCLVISALQHNDDSFNALVINNARFLNSIVRNFAYKFGVDREDLYQYSMYAYIENIKKYDIYRETKLNTYLYTWIKTTLYDVYLKNEKDFKITRKLYNTFAKASKLISEWEEENASAITDEEILNKGFLDINQLNLYRNVTNKVVHLEALAEANEEYQSGGNYEEFISITNDIDILKNVEGNVEYNYIKTCIIDSLKDRLLNLKNEKIVNLRVWGLVYDKKCSYDKNVENLAKLYFKIFEEKFSLDKYNSDNKSEHTNMYLAEKYFIKVEEIKKIIDCVTLEARKVYYSLDSDGVERNERNRK